MDMDWRAGDDLWNCGGADTECVSSASGSSSAYGRGGDANADGSGGSGRLKGDIKDHRLRLAGVLCLALVLFPAAGDNSTRIDRLGHQMMCMCGCNQILLECNHVGCTYSDRMRGELTAAVDSGSNDRGVLQSFIDKYGTTVLAAPTGSGFNRVAWIMPYVAFALGVLGLVIVVRSWKGRKPEPVAVNKGMTSTEIDRLREQARKETEL